MPPVSPTIKKGDEMKVEVTMNGSTLIRLVPEDSRDKAINRMAFDGNSVVSMDLREDGSVLFRLEPKNVQRDGK